MQLNCSVELDDRYNPVIQAGTEAGREKYTLVGTKSHKPMRGIQIDVDLVYAVTKFLWETQMPDHLFGVMALNKHDLVIRLRKGAMFTDKNRNKILRFIEESNLPKRPGW